MDLRSVTTTSAAAAHGEPEGTLRELAEELPALPQDAAMSAIAEVCLAADEQDWLVLLDERARPVRIIERAAVLRGEPFEHPVLALAAGTTIAAAARRAATRARRARLRPLVCCDAHGCYVGLVRMDRLLAALAG